MYTIALVNQKGGSGKSTLAECLAVSAYLDGMASAILDIDPQGSAYKWSKRRSESNPPVLSVTPANYEDEWIRLKENGADFVVFDTPARLDESTSRAIQLANLVIIPSKATVKDVERVGASFDLIGKTAQPKTFVVLNQVRSQGDRADQARSFLQAKGFSLCPHSFGYRVAFEDADTTGQTPQETDPYGKASEEIKHVYKYTIEFLNNNTSERVNNEQEKGSGERIASTGGI